MDIKKFISEKKVALLVTAGVLIVVVAGLSFSNGGNFQGNLDFNNLSSNKNASRVQNTSKPIIRNPQLSKHSYVVGDAEGVLISADFTKDISQNVDVNITLWNGPTTVRTYTLKKPGNGVISLTWDGKNEDKHLASPGSYVILYSTVQNGVVSDQTGTGLEVLPAQPILGLYQLTPKTYKIGDPNGLTINATLSNYQPGNLDDVQIRIYDSNGKQVKIFQNFKLANGPLTAVWHGEDDNGTIVQPGNYNVKFYFRKGLHSDQVSIAMPITVTAAN